MNSNVSGALTADSTTIIVSKSDLKQISGQAFDEAGILSLRKTATSGIYAVSFAAEGSVYLASCTKQ